MGGRYPPRFARLPPKGVFARRKGGLRHHGGLPQRPVLQAGAPRAPMGTCGVAPLRARPQRAAGRCQRGAPGAPRGASP
eukprot:11667071-Alexandrium_andersonii.AAC.1